MSGVDLDAVADELYGLWPAEFTAARTEREKEARAAGDKALAAQIKSLGKPTTVAWLANRLVRDHEDELRPLLELGDALREATAVLRGEDLRRLSQQQHQLVAALVRMARRDAAEAGHRVGEDSARGLEETLRAALADGDLAEELAAGRLTGQLQHSGFTPGAGESSAAGRKAPATPAPPKPVARASAKDRAAAKAAEEQRRAVERDRAERDLTAARLQAAEAAERHESSTAELDEATAAARAAAERVEELNVEIAEAVRAQAAADKRRASAEPAVAAAARDVRVADRLVTERAARLDTLR